jgi:hypothetical protein
LFFSKVIKLQIEQCLIKLFDAEQASGTAHRRPQTLTNGTLQRRRMSRAEDSY